MSVVRWQQHGSSTPVSFGDDPQPCFIADVDVVAGEQPLPGGQGALVAVPVFVVQFTPVAGEMSSEVKGWVEVSALHEVLHRLGK